MSVFPKGKPKPRRLDIWYFLDAKLCRFEFKPNPDDAFLFATEVEGVYLGHYLEWFEGGKSDRGHKKPPCYCACVKLVLEDGQNVVLKVSSPVPYYVLAARLQTIRHGDVIHVSTEKVGDSCCLDVAIARDGEWNLVPRIAKSISATVEAKVLQGTERYYQHPDYQHGEETPGPEGGWQAFQARGSTHSEADSTHKDGSSTHSATSSESSQRVKSELTFESFARQLGFSEKDRQDLVKACTQRRVRVRTIIHECLAAQINNPRKVIDYAFRRREAA